MFLIALGSATWEKKSSPADVWQEVEYEYEDRGKKSDSKVERLRFEKEKDSLKRERERVLNVQQHHACTYSRDHAVLPGVSLKKSWNSFTNGLANHGCFVVCKSLREGFRSMIPL